MCIVCLSMYLICARKSLSFQGHLLWHIKLLDASSHSFLFLAKLRKEDIQKMYVGGESSCQPSSAKEFSEIFNGGSESSYMLDLQSYIDKFYPDKYPNHICVKIIALLNKPPKTTLISVNC